MLSLTVEEARVVKIALKEFVALGQAQDVHLTHTKDFWDLYQKIRQFIQLDDLILK